MKKMPRSKDKEHHLLFPVINLVLNTKQAQPTYQVWIYTTINFIKKIFKWQFDYINPFKKMIKGNELLIISVKERTLAVPAIEVHGFLFLFCPSYPK